MPDILNKKWCHGTVHVSDFIWDFGKLPFPTHLGKYFIKIGKIRAKIREIGKIKAIFGLGMTPIYGLENGQIKSLHVHIILQNFALDQKYHRFSLLYLRNSCAPWLTFTCTKVF